jgi:type III restriction enzyme
VDEIYCEPGNEYVSFTAKPTVLRLGKAVGDVDDLTVKDQQIRRTIQEHLDKELVLNPQGIKVLSLFFIDRVANYRYYDKDGNPHKGIYAKLFEKNYKELIQLPKYRKLAGNLRDLGADVSKVHNGYFSQDKKGIMKDTSGTTAADENAYNLIMKDKEQLLSFDSKLRFIFSHSALREGWDNPNVFQICTLNETHSEVKKRQEIGRGLRLCVNQNGERQYGNSINTLTVMANESYFEFAAGLQHEYEEDEGIRFGILETYSFANISVKHADGTTAYLGEEKSGEIYHLFTEKGYIDASGRVQDKLRKALRDDLLEVPKDVIASKPAITAVCKKVCGSLKIRPANEKRVITPNKEVLLSADFKDLWDRIKYKTTYSVNFDSNELIKKCCEEMQRTLGTIQPAKLIFTKASLNITEGGVLTEENEHHGMHVQTIRQPLPDVVTYLQNATNLTRRTIADILVRSKTLNIFYKNPQRYMEEVSAIMKHQMRNFLVDGIKYTRLGDDEYYAQELFETEELTGYLERNMIASKKSAYHYVVYDSENEKDFAERFEANNAVKLYAKLPGWFKIRIGQF